MTNFIIRLFIKNYEDVTNPTVRTRYGVVSSTVGIVFNIILAALKFILGIFANSIAVTADAVNNLSDCASNIVTIIGFKLSSKPADREHPFGHGRIEYICGLVVAFLVLLAGFEVGKTSLLKIFSRGSSNFSVFVTTGLAVSVLTKLWLAFFYKKLGTKINSSTIKAVSTDSISDAFSTTVTLISIVLSKFTAFPLDGYIGILVSAFVMWSGIKIIRDTLTPLLGTTPNPDLVRDIYSTVAGHDKILGIHDLIVHEYGPGKVFASLHAEVSSSEDILESHELIDRIESELSKKLGIEITIHLDPLEVENEEVRRISKLVADALKKLDASFTMHDFRVIKNGDLKNILFDVVVPIAHPAPDSIVSDMVITAVSAIDQSFIVKPTIDRTVM
ncbi:MAG: cation transporter [Oscillospiraceae bacterium]|nr:cation transporter [Oscillospiraceae bacterium]